MIKVKYQKLMNRIKIKIMMMKKMNNTAQALILMKIQMIIIKAKKKKKMKSKINIFWKINMRKTPTEIAESAMLKTGLKNRKCSPPHIGNHSGKFPSINGK